MPAAAHGRTSPASTAAGRSLVIGYGAGGGYDLYARMLGRFMGAHVPGNPVVVPQTNPDTSAPRLDLQACRGCAGGAAFRSAAAALLMDDVSLRSVAGDNARKLRISLAVYSGTGSIQ